MTEDNKVIINPYSNLTDNEKQAVIKNEKIRLNFKENNIVPDIDITEEQRALFKGTPYENNEDAMKQTIVARIMTGDPSVNATEDQMAEASMYRRDGSKKSAQGFLGPILDNQGRTMSEFSIGLPIKQPDGTEKEMEVPSLVPGLTEEEINILRTDPKNIPVSIRIKAARHAEQRLREGKSVFYVDGE